MVGGYIYPLKELKPGRNDLVKMYGSVAAVRERINTAFKCGKPAILNVVFENGEKATVPFTASAPTVVGYDMKAGMFVVSVVIEESTAVAVVEVVND